MLFSNKKKDYKQTIQYKIYNKYKKHIKEDAIGYIIGTILVIAGIVASFFCGLCGLPLIISGLTIILQQMLLADMEEPKIGGQERGLPAYSGLNSDPMLYGGGNAIPVILGVSKTGTLNYKKKIFGDFNAYGLFFNLISDVDGFITIVGEYLNEKPLYLLMSTTNSEISEDEYYYTYYFRLYEYDTLNKVENYYEIDLIKRNSNVYNQYNNKCYLLNIIGDLDYAKYLYASFYYVSKLKIENNLSDVIYNIFGLNILKIKDFIKNKFNSLKINLGYSPQSYIELFDDYLYVNLDRPINSNFNVISIYNYGHLDIKGNVYYSNKLYNYTQSIIHDVPDENIVELRLNVQLSLYSINNFFVYDNIFIPVYEDNTITYTKTWTDEETNTTYTQTWENIFPIELKLLYNFSAGKWNATSSFHLKNATNGNITILAGQFTVNGLYNKNNCKNECEDKIKGGKLTASIENAVDIVIK